MDSFELNKIIGAILGTLLFVMGVGFLAEAIYHPIEGQGPGYTLPEPEGVAVADAAVEEPAVPLGVLLASANAEQGATAARKCQSCHNFEQGAGNKQGPELYGVVGRPIGSHEGFSYSDIMVSHHDAGDTWSYEALDHFLLAPKDYMPGTKMSFAGVKDDEERANIIAYLGSLSDAPVPFPEAEAAPAEDATAPAGDDAAVEGDEAAPASTEPAATDADALEAPAEPESPESAPATEAAPAEAPAAVDAAPAEEETPPAPAAN